MKKILCVALGIALLSTACSSSDTIESELKTTEAIKGDETVEAEPVKKSLFEDIFVELSRQIGTMSIDDCKTYIESENFDYDFAELSYMERITICDDVNDGFELAIDFYPNDNGEKTIVLVSYSNGNFGGSVSNVVHTKDTEYSIYDIFANPPNMNVDTLDEIVSFIKNDVPSKVSEYNNSVSGNTELDVALDVGYELKDEKVFFTVNTNLPDEATLILTLYNDDFTAQSKVIVENGEAISSGFSKNGEALSGNYTLDITMSIAKLQADSVAAVIGTQGEFLTGKYVEESMIGGGNIVSASFDFNF